MVPPKMPDTLQESIHRALRAWHEVEANEDTLLDNLLIVRARRQRHIQNGASLAGRLATNEILLEGIEKLESQDKIGSKILRERFLNDETTLKVAFMLEMGQDQVNRRQRKALETLTDILAMEDQLLRREEAAKMESELPPSSYTQLFGAEQSLETLLQVLKSKKAPWLISVTGLGGIGKTSLADAALRRVIQSFQFDRIMWVRAEANTLSGESPSPALTFEDLCTQLAAKLLPEGGNAPRPYHLIRQALKDAPHLIVFDNLESEADTLYLFNQLADLGGPSKIMITTRTRPPAQAGVFPLSLTELPTSDAFALIRHQAEITGLPELAQANDETLAHITQAAGGNPLALKLIVSLAQVLSIPDILADFPVGRSEPIEKMYRGIYWKSWQTLSPRARALLQVMPLVAMSGAQLDQLQAISELTEFDLQAAIQELAARSLLETRGTAWERRYGIHRLTETFLRTEIIDWPEEG